MISTTLWSLLALQIAMGAFDTFFHHEFTEKLPWRMSQRQELRLHGMRNLIYGVFFLVIGVTEPGGIFALFLIAALFVELIITLIDFVEEDRTRSLPASERVAHTLMALNYGAILVLFLPILAGWAARPTALQGAFHGGWSLMMLAGAAGVVVLGLRDLAASARLGRLERRPAGSLLGLPGRQRVLIAGATGFIGARVTRALVEGGHEVTVLARNTEKAARLGTPLHIVTHTDQISSDTRFDAIINLAGQPVAGFLWTPNYRRRIITSRVRMIRQLRKLAARLETPPSVFVNASAIGIYGIEAEAVRDDAPLTGDDSFSHRSCAMSEKTASMMQALGIRTVNLRIGLVLDTDGGVLSKLLMPFEFGMGGPFGTGTQWMSWISRDDLVRLIGHCLQTECLEGAVNAVAPAPVTNRDFAAALGSALHRPAAIPVPAVVLERGLGALGREIFLASQKVVPAKALASGFRFLDPELLPLLEQLTGTRRKAGKLREGRILVEG